MTSEPAAPAGDAALEPAHALLRDAAYVIDERVLCEACAMARFGLCPAHERPRLRCCASYGPTSYAAAEQALAGATLPDARRRCAVCTSAFVARTIVFAWRLPQSAAT